MPGFSRPKSSSCSLGGHNSPRRPKKRASMGGLSAKRCIFTTLSNIRIKDDEVSQTALGRVHIRGCPGRHMHCRVRAIDSRMYERDRCPHRRKHVLDQQLPQCAARAHCWQHRRNTGSVVARDADIAGGGASSGSLSPYIRRTQRALVQGACRLGGQCRRHPGREPLL